MVMLYTFMGGAPIGNPIYDIRNRRGKTERIIGSEEDRAAIMEYARVRAIQESTNTDVQEAIKELSEDFRKEKK